MYSTSTENFSETSCKATETYRLGFLPAHVCILKVALSMGDDWDPNFWQI